MTTLNEIQKFLSHKKVAVAGASRNPKKFGGTVFKELKEKGFELYPINPNAVEIQGVKCYDSVESLPEEVQYLYIVTPRAETELIAKAAVKKGMRMVWIQQKSDTPEAVKAITEANISLIHKKCILMFVDPVKAPHNVHRFFSKLFGGYPKMVAPSQN